LPAAELVILIALVGRIFGFGLTGLPSKPFCTTLGVATTLAACCLTAKM
jgi:hypothetical protein